MRKAKGPREQSGRCSGFTMIEILIVVGVLMFTLLLFSQSMGSAMSLNGVNRETALATEGARWVLERMQGGEFPQLYERFGPGGDPGPNFAVDGLDPDPDDPDGLVGEIRFPTVAGAGGPELHEDVVDESLGMPRDLNGNGMVDAGNRAGDYRLLPVEVTLRWRGRTGIRTLRIQTLLADR